MPGPREGGPSLSVCSGTFSEHPDWGLVNHKNLFSQFWKLEVQGQRSGMVSEGQPLPWFIVGRLLAVSSMAEGGDEGALWVPYKAQSPS